MGLIFLLVAVQGTILSVIEVSRHGARSPIIKYSWDQSDWKQGLGELTPEGIRQHYLNGVEFRSRYIIDNQLINKQYNSSQVYFRSTDVNRTIVSAMSQLMGFFPEGPKIPDNSNPLPPLSSSEVLPIIESLGPYALPNSFSPVPIHIVSPEHDSLLLGFYPKVCPYISKILKEAKQSQEYLAKKKDYEDLWKPEIDKIFGHSVDFTLAASYSDVLISQQFQGYPWPGNMTDSVYSKMVEIGAYDLTLFFKGKGAWLASSEFYSGLLKSFKQVIDKETSVRWWYYSAHDTTLVGFLMALGIYDDAQPPFASSLIFELVEEYNEHYLRIIYNDQVKVLPGCSQLCSLQWVKEYLEQYIIKDVALECNKDDAVALEKKVEVDAGEEFNWMKLINH